MTSVHDIIYPLLPLRDIVAFPGLVMPLLVGRPKSIRACKEAIATGRPILLVAQRDGTDERPALEGLYPIGTVAAVQQHLALPQGRMKLVVEGHYRARILEVTDDGLMISASAEPINDPVGNDARLGALRHASAETIGERFRLIGGSSGSVPAPAPNLVPELQRILEADDLVTSVRLDRAFQLLASAG